MQKYNNKNGQVIVELGIAIASDAQDLDILQVILGGRTILLIPRIDLERKQVLDDNDRLNVRDHRDPEGLLWPWNAEHSP